MSETTSQDIWPDADFENELRACANRIIGAYGWPPGEFSTLVICAENIPKLLGRVRDLEQDRDDWMQRYDNVCHENIMAEERIAELQKVILTMADRVVAQSECLSRTAEKKTV